MAIYRITINRNGGDLDTVFYVQRGATRNEFFADDAATIPIDKAPLPTRTGYNATGAYASSTSTTTQYVEWDGTITEALYALNITGNRTFYAQWAAAHYTLDFDLAGGAGEAVPKYVFYGSAVGALPTPTHPRGTFTGWSIGGTPITSTTVWYYTSNQTAVAEYDLAFGTVTDYFGLASANLIPISSDSGENAQHVVAYNAPSETPASEDTIAWLNPTVVYEVVGNVSLTVLLGRGYRCEVDRNVSGNHVTRTGYMITSASLETSIGAPPRIRVTAVANEGYTMSYNTSGTPRYNPADTNAVKTYSVTFNVTPRHRPQDVMSSISAPNWELQSMTTTASCDPVILAEGGVPCASDAVHGRIETSGTIADYGGGGGVSAGTGFALTGRPLSRDGVGYKSMQLSLRKELT